MDATTRMDAGEYAHACFGIYSDEVLKKRMLPHAFDGLKPVQRRLLIACDRLNLKPEAAFVKCVQVVGYTLALYHPHSDSSCYGALVNITGANPPTHDGEQSGGPINHCNVPLLEGQGNFGDHEDGPAAMRYTECRPTRYAYHTLMNREYMSVLPTVTTESGSDQEQCFLPALLPNLLMNGADGTAIALSTSIPSFTPASVAAATLAVLTACKQDVLPSREKVAALLAEHLVYKYRFGGYMAGSLSVEDCLSNVFSLDVWPHYTMEKDALVVHSIHHKHFKPQDWLEKAETLPGTKHARDETGQHGLRFVVTYDRKSGVPYDAWEKAVRNSLRRKLHCQINAVTGFGEKAEAKMMTLADLMLYWVQVRLEMERHVVTQRIDEALVQELHLLAVRYAVENRDTFFPLLEEDDAEQALTAFYQPWLGEEAGDAARYILGVSLRTLTRASADDLLKRLKDVEALLQKLEGNLAAIVKTTRASTEATLKTLAAAKTAHKGR